MTPLGLIGNAASWIGHEGMQAGRWLGGELGGLFGSQMPQAPAPDGTDTGDGQGAPQTQTPAQQVPQRAQAGVPQFRNPNLGTVAADWLLGGMSPMRAYRYEKYDVPAQMATRQALLQTLQEMTPEERKAYFTNAPEYGKAMASHFAAADLGANTSRFIPGHGNVASGPSVAQAGEVIRDDTGNVINAAPGKLAPDEMTTNPITGVGIYRSAPKREITKRAASEIVGVAPGGAPGMVGPPMSLTPPPGAPMVPTVAAPGAPAPAGGIVPRVARTSAPGQFDLTPNVVKTIAGEAASQGPVGQQAVLGVMINRARQSGQTLDQVATAPHQFPGLNNRIGRTVAPGTPAYQQVMANVSPVLTGGAPNPAGDADHYYAPGMMPTPPKWAQGQQGTDIGAHRFYALGYGGHGSATVDTGGNQVPPPPAPPGQPNYDTVVDQNVAEHPRVLTATQDRTAAGIAPTDHGGYMMMPDGTIQKTGVDPFPAERVVQTRDAFNGSDEMKHLSESRKAYNGFTSALAQFRDNNGILNMAGLDSYLKSINPGMGVRNATAQMLIDHIGLPEEIKSELSNKFGKGFLTPVVLNQMTTVMHAYVNSAYQEAQRRAKQDAALASHYGVDPAALAEDIGEPPAPPPGSMFGKPTQQGHSQHVTARPAPKPGDMVRGYRYNGGDPSSPQSWTVVQ